MQSKVPIGPTTVAGYGATLVGLIAAVLATVFPDVPEQQLALVASSAFTVIAFVVTQVGRYGQARDLAKRPDYSGVTSAGLTEQSKVMRAGTTTTTPRPSADISNVPRAIQRYDDEEPGDPDALPEYESDMDIPADGDDQAVRA